MVAVETTPQILVAPAPRPSGVTVRFRAGRAVVLAIAAIYFFGPLLAAFWFSIHNSAGVSFRAYTHMFSAPGLTDSLTLSLALGAVTVVLALVLLIPTMLLVHLRYPALRPAVEALTLFPLVVPPIVLVVGVSKLIGYGNTADPVSFTGQLFNQLLNSKPPLVLVFEYVVLVLPFTYRSIDAGLQAVDVRTLVEAALNLGASWRHILVSVILPALRTSVLTAAILAFALVFGEFTMASVLQYQTFTVWLLQFQNDDGQLSVALALMSLVLTWLVLLAFTAIAGRDPSTRKAPR